MRLRCFTGTSVGMPYRARFFVPHGRADMDNALVFEAQIEARAAVSLIRDDDLPGSRQTIALEHPRTHFAFVRFGADEIE